MDSADLQRTIPPILVIGGLFAAILIAFVFDARELAFVIFAISAFIGVFHFSKLSKNP
ncbi:MAG: hypothetical protein ACXACI_13250 [Candidatus Hodarchaeales archaeon]|jgi:hypothetical protein